MGFFPGFLCFFLQFPTDGFVLADKSTIRVPEPLQSAEVERWIATLKFYKSVRFGALLGTMESGWQTGNYNPRPPQSPEYRHTYCILNIWILFRHVSKICLFLQNFEHLFLYFYFNCMWLCYDFIDGCHFRSALFSVFIIQFPYAFYTRAYLDTHTHSHMYD